MADQKQDCTIDHSLQDVKEKLQPFLVLEFGTKLTSLLEQGKFNQQQLNELYHHLKKLQKYQGKISDIIREVD